MDFTNGSGPYQPEKIIRVEASGNYSKIYFASGYPVIVPKVLQWFQRHLPQQMFLRVHRSHLVNKIFISQINGNKNKTILLSNGDKIVISRRKKNLLMV